jgi:hypothetical protein
MELKKFVIRYHKRKKQSKNNPQKKIFTKIFSKNRENFLNFRNKNFDKIFAKIFFV